uniref:Uncharacterized protein n=1 Tax=Tetranychus urticae TaxID=32264 RepID=T1KF18_TETUR
MIEKMAKTDRLVLVWLHLFLVIMSSILVGM